MDHGAGVGSWRYPVAPGGQASAFLLPDHGEVWESPGSVEAYVWTISNGVYILNTKAKPCPPELGQLDLPAVATCFTSNTKGCHFILAFILHLFIIRLCWWEGVVKDCGHYGRFLVRWTVVEGVTLSQLGSLGDCESGPSCFWCLALLCIGQDMEGKRKYKNHAGGLPTWFALFNIWGPCIFFPPPLGHGSLLICLFLLFLHSHFPNSDLNCE